MKRVQLIAAVIMFSFIGNVAAETDPVKWYQSVYAPPWKTIDTAALDSYTSEYLETLYLHSDNGEIEVVERDAWMADLFAEWLTEGWTGSEVEGLVADRVNATMTTFRARWRDHYSNQPDEFSCGWYQAKFQNDSWKFSSYADIDCDSVEFE
jgi:hypothetical protein